MYVWKALNVFDLLRNRCNPSKTNRSYIISWEEAQEKSSKQMNDVVDKEISLVSSVVTYSWVTTSNLWIHMISPVEGTKLENSVSNFASLVAYVFQAIFGRHQGQKQKDELQWYKINMFKCFIYIHVKPICLRSQSKMLNEITQTDKDKCHIILNVESQKRQTK